MSELKIKGIWLSKEILDIPELNIKEKMILALSINLYKSNKKCFVSNKVFSKLIEVKPRELLYVGHILRNILNNKQQIVML